jgi:hypothetical protein
VAAPRGLEPLPDDASEAEQLAHARIAVPAGTYVISGERSTLEEALQHMEFCREHGRTRIHLYYMRGSYPWKVLCDEWGTSPETEWPNIMRVVIANNRVVEYIRSNAQERRARTRERAAAELAMLEDLWVRPTYDPT